MYRFIRLDILMAVLLLVLGPIRVYSLDNLNFSDKDTVSGIHQNWLSPLSDTHSFCCEPVISAQSPFRHFPITYDPGLLRQKDNYFASLGLEEPMRPGILVFSDDKNSDRPLSVGPNPDNKDTNTSWKKNSQGLIAGLTEEEWKLLEGPIEKRDRTLFYPVLYHAVWYSLIIGAGFIYYDLYRPAVLNWQEISLDRMLTNVTTFNWRWDGDRIFFNYVAHPIMGSEAYLRLRMRGFEWYESLLFSFLASTAWEFTEALVEQVSIQDMFVTPIAGVVLGEMRFKAKLWLRKRDSVLADVAEVIVDPVQSLMDAIYGLFGDPQDVRLPNVRVQFFYQTDNYRFTF